MRVTPVAIAIVVCALVRSVSAQISLDAVQRDGYGVVSIARPEPNVLTVDAQINGHRAKLIIDTGWGREGLTLDSDYAKFAANREKTQVDGGTSISGAKIKETRGVVDSVVLGNVQLAQVPSSFTELAPARMQEQRRTVGADGFITSGFLKTCSAIIDLHNLRLYLKPPGKGRRAALGPALTAIGFAEVPFGYSSHICYVKADVNGVEGAMALDTGASLGLLDSHFATKAHAYGYDNHMQLLDAAGNHADLRLAHLNSFKLNGIAPLKATNIGVTDFSGYSESKGQLVGLIGMDILGPNGTIIDFGNQKLYFFKAK
jgi:hypothetical protein